ncbi:MAG: cardiolipin synthase [Planctomycetaceae bacterium]|nr:cardiolipin synthase [Planctomycetaceae bacterium]
MNWYILTALEVSVILTTVHVLVVGGIAFRVVMQKPAIGVALSWLVTVAVFPAFGAVLYLLVGERRVGQRRAMRIAERRADNVWLATMGIHGRLREVDWSRHRREARAMHEVGMRLVGVPTVSGSTGELVSTAEEILRGIAADVDGATCSVLMEFYIWHAGGLADVVVAALERAARRGVACRVLVDAIGSRPWLKGDQPRRLRAAGVQVRAAFPAGLWHTLFARNDLRLHRKIVVIDDRIAWTGSMNLVDPCHFKQEANVGQWIDAMARIEGAAIAPLAMTVIGDWTLESDEAIEPIVQQAGLDVVEQQGNGDVQVIPSGPAESDDGLLQMLLTLIHSAHEELVLTTPYFIPDESLMRALRGAAARGVEVHLIVPQKVDSILAHYASRSYFEELMHVGVRVHLYHGGLLHTKSITVDRRLAMFGTVNLDMRSLWLNYEVSLFLYGESVAGPLRALQYKYMLECHVLDMAVWQRRPLWNKMLENVLRLASPLL